MNVEENISLLRHKRHFNHVEWDKIKDQADMHELQDSLKRFKKFKVDDGLGEAKDALVSLDKMGQLQ